MLADLEEALDFLGHAAHGHNLDGMAHRAGKGEIEAHRHLGEGREQGREFGA